MPETASMTTETAPPVANGRALWWPGLAFAVAGALAATAFAAVGHAAGASLKAGGEAFPLLGFAQLAFVFSVVGVVLAAACRRWAAQPARVFLRATLVLLALSILPDLLMSGVGTATRVTLMGSHLAVAAIVIPGVRSRLR